MRKSLAATILIALTATAFSSPSSAQSMRLDKPTLAKPDITNIHYKERRHSHKRHFRGDVLSPRKIARKLHRHGYHNIERIRLRNGRYRVRAYGHRGPVKLIVHARSGEILYRERIRRQQHHYGKQFHGQHGGWTWSYRIR